MEDNPTESQSSRVERFLLAALKKKSLDAYLRALGDIRTEVALAGFPWSASTPAQRDAFLADVFVGRQEEGESRQKCVLVCAALKKLSPGEKFPVASAVLQVWAALSPPRQAPACPSEIA